MLTEASASKAALADNLKSFDLYGHIEGWIESSFGLDAGGILVDFIAHSITGLALALACVVVHLIVRRVLVTSITSIVDRTRNRWDNAFIDNRVFHRLAHVAPALVLYTFSSNVFRVPQIVAFTEKLAIAYIIIVVARAFDGFLNAVVQIYRHFDKAKTRPIKSYVQVVKIVLYVFASIMLVATILGKDPSGLLVGLGGMSAVLLLVFKDSIMGLVASVQLVNNDMVRRGDWISMPSYKADGDVLDITLNTVKIKNFDNTITTIPTYALITNSFQNWRGMQESGGRRIKRAIRVDMNTVKFCDDSMVDNFKKFDLLREYFKGKLEDIETANQEVVSDSVVTNGRRLTNIGTFRAYIEAYLKAHPKINKELTFLVRQLAPGESGLPIELYVFSSDKRWANYEAIQADIFDHLLAIMPEFDLKPFQYASGNDFGQGLR